MSDLVRIDQSAAFPGYPAAVSAGGLLFLSGVRPRIAGRIPKTFADLPEEGRIGQQGFAFADADDEAVTVDAWGAFDEMDRVLAAAGASQEHMLRTRIWQKDKRFYPPFERVRLVRQPNPSASSGHSVSALPGIGGRVIGLDGVAVAPGAGERTASGGTRGAERPLTFYSLAAQHGDFAFLAGHIPVTALPGFPSIQGFEDIPEEGRKFATGRSHADSRDGPVAAATWYVYDQMRRNLEKIGASMDDIVHCLVGLRDMRDIGMFHRIHRDVFGDAGPALTIVGAGEVGHRHSHVVIEPTIYTGSDKGRVEWPDAPLSAPLARRAGDLLFLSGQAGFSSARTFPDDIAFHHRRTWTNLSDALRAAGSSLERLVKLTVFLRDPADWSTFEAVRKMFLSDEFLPAIECVTAPHPGPTRRSAVQIDAVALSGAA